MDTETDVLTQVAETLQFCMEQLKLARAAIANERRTDMWTIGGNVDDAANAIYFALRDLGTLGFVPGSARPLLMPKRVRVVRASGEGFWYANRIGEVFEIVRPATDDYITSKPSFWVINPDEPDKRDTYVIDASDCEPVPGPADA